MPNLVTGPPRQGLLIRDIGYVLRCYRNLVSPLSERFARMKT